jgi:alkylation response protein AidB-like acyl-CoA dehydrogenase
MSWVSQEWLEGVDDVIREDTLRAMDELRWEQGAAFWEVFELISRADPEGLLGMGCPPNEYVSEARTIHARRSEARSAQEVRRIVEEEFRRWFGTAYGEDGGVSIDEDYQISNRDTDLDALAAAIWRVWSRQSQREG